MYKLLYFKSQNAHIRKYEDEIKEIEENEDIQRLKNKIIRNSELMKISKADLINQLEDLSNSLKEEKAIKPAYKDPSLEKKEELSIILKNDKTSRLREYLSKMSDEEFNKALEFILNSIGRIRTLNVVNNIYNDRTLDFSEIDKADELIDLVSSVDLIESIELNESIKNILPDKTGILAARSYLTKVLKKNKMNENIISNSDFRGKGAVQRINNYLLKLQNEGKDVLF